MYIAMYGPKGFTVSSSKIFTFTDFGFSSSLQTETQESTDKKPSTYIKGAGLDTFSIKLRLDATLGIKPLEEIESWMRLKDEGKAYPFLLKGKPLLQTKWLLKEVAASDTTIDHVGNLMAATLSLSFEEFVKAGSAKAKATASGASSKTKSGSSSKSGAVDTSVYEALAPTPTVPKEEMKRTSRMNHPGIKPTVEVM